MDHLMNPMRQKRTRFPWAGLALAAWAAFFSGCGPRLESDPILGRWDVAGVEHQGRFVKVGDHVALAHIPGTQSLSRQGFELTRSGKYLSGNVTARWKPLDKGSFQVEYSLHGESLMLKVEYKKKGKQLLIRKPRGEMWIVLEPAS